MRIEILNTGTELLLGTTLNSHGAWIGLELMKLGLRVQQQLTVPDGEAVRDAISAAVDRCDVLLVTGGLGPTSDDLTRESTAEAMGIELMEDEHALRCVLSYFEKRGREMAPGNRKQALIPCGAEVLPNPNGTAPGVYVPPRLGKGAPCAVFLLPGPPNELHPMFLAEVPHRLRALAEISEDQQMVELKFTGIGESDFHQSIDQELANMSDLEVGYCARPGELDLRLIGTQESLQKARRLVGAKFSRQMVSDDGSSLEQVVVRMLASQGKKVTAAESCTGGLIASRLTDVSGSSEVFGFGYVTYANEAKSELLGVDEALLERHGAVSSEVAQAMAQGALCSSGADVAIAVTGIAGPAGGSEQKPVGTVYLSLAARDGYQELKKSFHPRGREVFKSVVSQDGLEMLRQYLLDAVGDSTASS